MSATLLAKSVFYQPLMRDIVDADKFGNFLVHVDQIFSR